MGIGANRIAKSVRIQGIGSITFKRYWLPQCPGTLGFHRDLTGEQTNAPAKVIEIHQEATIAISTSTVVRNALVMNIRYSSIKIDSFDDASRHGCISDAE